MRVNVSEGIATFESSALRAQQIGAIGSMPKPLRSTTREPHVIHDVLCPLGMVQNKTIWRICKEARWTRTH